MAQFRILSKNPYSAAVSRSIRIGWLRRRKAVLVQPPPLPSIKIWFMRHGENDAWHLSDQGKLQAARAGRQLQSQLSSSAPIRLLVSPQGRTIETAAIVAEFLGCLLYTSPSPRDRQKSRMPSSA